MFQISRQSVEWESQMWPVVLFILKIHILFTIFHNRDVRHMRIHSCNGNFIYLANGMRLEVRGSVHAVTEEASRSHSHLLLLGHGERRMAQPACWLQRDENGELTYS